MRIPPTKRQLAASLLVCAHIADREVIAGFLADEATQVGTNPFRQTSVGAQLQIWVGHNFEFRSSRTEALGLLCLLRTLGELPRDEPLVQEILQAGPYRAYVYHRGDGCQIVGSVLHARPGVALPIIPKRARRRRAKSTSLAQLDLFMIPMPSGGPSSGCNHRVLS
jgi:hypothetical protein